MRNDKKYGVDRAKICYNPRRTNTMSQFRRPDVRTITANGAPGGPAIITRTQTGQREPETFTAIHD